MARKKDSGKGVESGKISICTFGGLTIRYEGVPATILWESQKARILFCYLLITYDQWVHRDKLIELLWPECDPSSGTNNFKTTISRLRKSFSGSQSFNPVLTQGDAVRLNFANISLDASEFRHNATTGVKLFARGDMKAAREYLEAAQDLYSGVFLPEEPFNSFISATRRELSQLHVSALQALETIYQDEGNEHAINILSLLRRSPALELA